MPDEEVWFNEMFSKPLYQVRPEDFFPTQSYTSAARTWAFPFLLITM
jgi:hypothetical protein